MRERGRKSKNGKAIWGQAENRATWYFTMWFSAILSATHSAKVNDPKSFPPLLLHIHSFPYLWFRSLYWGARVGQFLLFCFLPSPSIPPQLSRRPIGIRGGVAIKSHLPRQIVSEASSAPSAEQSCADEGVGAPLRRHWRFVLLPVYIRQWGIHLL